MNTETIITIVGHGSQVILDCYCHSWKDLVEIVKASIGTKAKITLCHIPFTDEAILELVTMAPDNLCIDLTRQPEWEEDED